MSDDGTNTNCLTNIKCPRCGSLEPFRIEVTSLMTVWDNGTDDYGEVMWEDDAYIECIECNFHGKVHGFTTEGGKPL